MNLYIRLQQSNKKMNGNQNKRTTIYAHVYLLLETKSNIVKLVIYS